MSTLHGNIRLLLLLFLLSGSTKIVAGSPSGYVVWWGVDLFPETRTPATNYYSAGLVRINGQLLSNAVEVSGAGSHALALRSDGIVVGWGGNHFGEAVGFENRSSDVANGPVQIGGKVLDAVAAIAVGRAHSVALKIDGTVVAWGDNQFGQAVVPVGLSNVTAVSAGEDHNLAIKSDRTVVGWGNSNVPKELANIVAVAASKLANGRDFALTTQGEVVEWSNVEKPSLARQIPGLTNIAAISGGWSHNLALTRDGTVIGWGSNQYGEATGVAATNYQDRSIGKVILDGQILSNVTAVAAGSEYSLALKKDGSVVAWGKKTISYRQTEVPPGLSHVIAIAAGENFSLAITTNLPTFPK